MRACSSPDIRNGRSQIRNRGIASVLRRIRYMERFGAAWEKIQAKMVNGYPEPRFDGDNPVFCATLWPHPSLAGSLRSDPECAGRGGRGRQCDRCE